MRRLRMQTIHVIVGLVSFCFLDAPYASCMDGDYYLSDDVHNVLGCEGHLEIDESDFQKEAFLFRLFVPLVTRTPGFDKKLPVVVWLHGHGPDEFFQPNVGHLFHIHGSLYIDYVRPADANFFLLAVQCPAMDRPWFGKQPESPEGNQLIEPGEAVVQIVKRLCREVAAIDCDRVSLIGISSGGTAVLEMGIRHPQVFSAIAPTSSRGGDISRIARLKDVPVWAFYNVQDSQVLISELTKTMKALQESGGICALTGVPGMLDGHDSWHEAFSQHHLLDWLLAQERAQSRWTSHSKWLRHTHLNWDYLGPQSVLIALLIICWIIWRIERIRRRRDVAVEIVQ